jgi:hypothetical protein
MHIEASTSAERITILPGDLESCGDLGETKSDEPWPGLYPGTGLVSMALALNMEKLRALKEAARPAWITREGQRHGDRHRVAAVPGNDGGSADLRAGTRRWFIYDQRPPGTHHPVGGSRMDNTGCVRQVVLLAGRGCG